MKNKFLNWLKQVLGITELKSKITQLERNERILIEKNIRLERLCLSISEDNRTILYHVKMINKDFLAFADISPRPQDPSVVLVLRNTKDREQIKTYSFNNETVREIHRFIEGFGKDRVITDSRKYFPGPRFKY